MKCPHCKTDRAVIKAGFTRKKIQQYRCKTCKSVFTGQEKYHRFSEEDKSFMVLAAQEGNGVRAIARMLKREHHSGVNDFLKKSTKSIGRSI